MTTLQYSAIGATSPVAGSVKVEVSCAAATVCDVQRQDSVLLAVRNLAPNASPPALPASPTLTFQVRS